MIATSLALTLLAATGGAPASTDGLFPPATTMIPITAKSDENEGTSLLQLTNLYAESTGQRASYSIDTRTLLANHRVPVDGDMLLEVDEIQGMYETLMHASDYVICPGGTPSAPLFTVRSINGNHRGNLRSQAIFIDPETAREVGTRHPAVLFMTVVQVPHSDARQLSNSTRTLITDANLQQLLPGGSGNSLVIVGLGGSLASMIDTVEAIDRMAAEEFQSDQDALEIVQLTQRDAQGLADLINSAGPMKSAARPVPGPQPQNGQARLSVVADTHTNSLLLRGPKEQLAQMRAVIARLDVPGRK